MKNAIWLGCLLGIATAGSGVAHAQDSFDDYEAYFGFEDPEEEEEDRPRSIAEAKKMGKGYRIGSTGVHSKKRDVHIVSEGDTLWDISEGYFGNPWYWPELWSFNPEITNPHWIYPLDQIRLSPGQLAQDQMVERIETGRAPAGILEGGATPGQMSGTETAPSVIVPRTLWKPGTIFLRDQGYLDREALRTVGQIVSGNEEHMMLSPSDQVYIRFRKSQDVRAGQQYAVFRTIHDWERAEKEQGTLVRVHGTIVIRSYDRNKHIARGVITEGLDPIERGFFVAQLDRRFDLVPPKRNETNVVAKVIASIRPRTLLGFGNVVFLDVGRKSGVKPGNRFFVVRKGDNWLDNAHMDAEEMGSIVEVPPYERDDLPKEVVAELRVIKVRKHTTIALVTRSDTDIFNGDVCEMRSGF